MHAIVRRMANRPDFIDEIVDQRSERNPEFPDLVEAAVRRRELLRELAARREKLGLSQTLVAARMGTSQSAVARLEAGGIDAKVSTLQGVARAPRQKAGRGGTSPPSPRPSSGSPPHSARRSSGGSRRLVSGSGNQPGTDLRTVRPRT